jgi:hypothetical protein
MRPLPKLYLLLSSLLFLVFVSCRISKLNNNNGDRVFITKELITPVLSSSQPLKFKATIDVLKNHLTGILIVKQTDSVSTHFIFVTELGMKMFDFLYKDNRMEAVYVFEPLNKPKLIQSLMRNFEDMTLIDVFTRGVGSAYGNFKENYKLFSIEKIYTHNLKKYLITDSLTRLHRQEIFNHNRKSSLINYTYNTTTQSYSQITCIQYGLVKIHIELNEIPKTND